jgi:hypothetical protein
MTAILETTSAAREAPMGSDRSFGLVFAAVFALIGVWPLVGLAEPHWWAFAVAAASAIAALAAPRLLRPFNRAWLLLGRAMHRVMSPLVMGAIYFLCVTPTGWIMRLRGKDLLELRRRPDLASYWVVRPPANADADSMKNQF